MSRVAGDPHTRAGHLGAWYQGLRAELCPQAPAEKEAIVAQTKNAVLRGGRDDGYTQPRARTRLSRQQSGRGGDGHEANWNLYQFAAG